jgi:hypothetical protein
VLFGFNTQGCRGVRVIQYHLAGGRHSSVVSSCTLEVAYEEHQEEVSVEFGDNPPALATLLAFVDALNATLA